MKVVGTIINKNWNLVGLMLKGKPSELGINANKDWMISHFTIEEAKSLIKKSKSCDFSIDNNGNIKSNSTKQLKDLPMYNIDGMPINNDIFIESLIEQYGDIVGAVIVYPLLNEKKKLKLKEVQSLSTYFNTSNFSVRVRDDEPYITGKGDTKREDIPVVKLKPEHTNKDLALYMRISSFDLIGELVNGKNDTYSVYVDGWFCSLQFPKWMEEKVLALLERICDDTVVKEDLQVNLFEEDLLDSLAFTELLVAIEEQFGIVISPSQVERTDVETPEKIINLIGARS